MSVLITGGAGFIGSHLAERLVEENFEVIVFDDLSAGSEKNFSSFIGEHSLKFVRGDVRHLSALRRCFDEVSSVVHLAGITSVSQSIQNPQECSDINVNGTANVLKLCVDNGVSRLLYASSSAVYGEPKSLPVCEEQPLKAISPYAASKISGENLCAAYDGINGLETICLRFFNVYGPRQSNNGYSNVISKFLGKIRSSSSPLIYGDGQQSRDFIHVSDIVELLTEVIIKETACGVYNVGTGREVTINYLADTILKLCGASGRTPVHIPAQPGEVRHSCADISKITSELGFEPKIKLEQGLHDLIKEDDLFPGL